MSPASGAQFLKRCGKLVARAGVFVTAPPPELPVAAGHAAIEVGILAMAMAILGWVLIPSHWTSIWMDREFTGCVAPLANRLVQGERLYTDGAHSPLPPLPFLLMRWLGGGQATWWTESACNFAFQALAIMLMYLALRRFLRFPVPFLAAFAAMPVFFCLRKAALYDSMVQAEVALQVFLVVHYFTSRDNSVQTAFRWARPDLLGLASAAALGLLIKQSTGVGACLGVALALGMHDNGNWSARLRAVGAYLLWTGITLACAVVLLRPWVDGVGLVQDVFITGAEAKGGLPRLWENLGLFAGELLGLARLLILPLVVVIVLLRLATRCEAGQPKPTPRPLLVYAAAVLASALLVLVYLIEPGSGPWIIHYYGYLVYLLPAGLLLAMGASLRCSVAAARVGPALPAERGLAAAFTITFAAAIFHSLSTRTFRWTYDNNPLIVVAYAACWDQLARLFPRVSQRIGSQALVVTGCLVLVLLRPWARFSEQVECCRQCQEQWPEIAHLRGAYLNPDARGMRRLCAIVRDLTTADDTVLLMPNDPNVEAWFARPRPRLSSLFVFADQYLDRFVEADLRTLEEQLPALIVIGPRKFWRGFHRLWRRNYGAERLLDALMADVLPRHYSRPLAVPIRHDGRDDFMDVYLRIRGSAGEVR